MEADVSGRDHHPPDIRSSEEEEEEDEESPDENQNLLRRSVTDDGDSKNTLQVPDGRGRSLSSPSISPDILLTFSAVSETARRLSGSSRISYKTFDWDSSKMNKEEGAEARIESFIKASKSMLGLQCEDAEISAAEREVVVAELQQEISAVPGVFANNNSAQTTVDRRKAFLRMTSLNSDLSIEHEVACRQRTWTDEVDSPVRSGKGVPYMTLHAKPVPYQGKGRRIFIEKTPIHIKIVDCGRVHSTLHLNPNLYYIEIEHGPCTWAVRRRYNHFLRLHEELILYKARLHIPVGRESHRERHRTFRELPDDVNDLPHFPRTLDALVRAHQLSKRMLQLEKYLQGVANNPLYINHPKMLEFLEVSHISFVDELGEKGKEGWVMKRSGGRRVQLGCFSSLSCSANSHYSKRWLIVKDSFVAYVRPKDGLLRAVLLMDQDLKVAVGRENTGLYHGLKITNTFRNLLLRCNHKSVALDWKADIARTAESCEYTFDNPHGSFAPPRDDTLVQGFADGSDYFESIADALETAKQQIFILDWCLNLQIFLKRPPQQDNRWRLDCILKRKADEGVKVFVLLYKEVEIALNLGSLHTKQTLLALHPNIKVMRHPDHLPGGAGVMLWAHHEKGVIIDQRIAFIGGIDICYGRWDDFRHRLVDTGDACYQQEEPAGEDVPDGRAKQARNQNGGLGHNGYLTGVEKRMHSLGIVEGAKQLWLGKDYYNPIFKDVVQPELPFEETMDRSSVPRLPWHDIAAVVHGKAALDVARHFIQRWNFTKEQKKKEMSDVPLLIPKSSATVSDVGLPCTPGASRCRCQILRSSCQWSAGMQHVEDSIHQAYIHAINNSKHYIYIENQFFVSIADDPDVSNGIADAIFERIVRAHRAGETFRVYILMPLLPAFEGDVGGDSGAAIRVILHWEYRSIIKGDNAILQRLYQEDITSPEEYINFYGLRTHDALGGKLVTELIYIHCKLMIVDDTKVILGSANINDRSMLGSRDSELAVLIEDTEMVGSVMDGERYMAGKFALQFRQQLFREHLGILKGCDGIDVSDPVSDAFYNDTWIRIAVTNTNIYDEVFKCIPTDRATTYLELQQFKREPSLAHSDHDAAEERLAEVTGHLVSTPLYFLCDENLQPSMGETEGLAPTRLWV
ncbi:phospholipase D1 [Strongylocentrotus purpuratus]|uniref:Phospholipase n=1 Tax=Strongylocentrotus purpuratus TaxID=7668 RepID=A0A7M7SZY4_STRPU|nr:phospholipase D1 [Strongylocentrotus purpuratus]